jgi:hypothetical protein
MKYYCPKKTCSLEGDKPFILKISIEACMDEKNVATVFCPYCESKMIEFE